MQEPKVLARSEGVVAVDKPAGLAVHPAGLPEPTLLAWCEALEPGLAPVHRLDKETSGVVLCAADPELRAALSADLEARRIEKTYLALVFGRPHKKGAVRRPLKEAGRDVEAVTRFRTLAWLGKAV